MHILGLHKIGHHEPRTIKGSFFPKDDEHLQKKTIPRRIALIAFMSLKAIRSNISLGRNDKHIEGTFVAYQNDKTTYMRFSCVTNL